MLSRHFRLTESRMVSIMRARKKDRLEEYRGLAQSGSAPALGAGCRGFKSLIPDQLHDPSTYSRSGLFYTPLQVCLK